MKTFREFIENKLQEVPYHKNPQIGWWKDGEHLHMYHGTHESNLSKIEQNGIKAPEHGPTKGWVSLTHDPHTAHGYAAMGGESGFRAAGAKATTVPHEKRVVLHLKIPRAWAEKNMNHEMRGNIGNVQDNLTNKDKYDAHKASGKSDSEYYQTTELRFKDKIPRDFITGYSRRYPKNSA